MARQLQTSAQQDIIYPDSDGQPMADNTKQFRVIVTTQGGLDALFQNEPNVFVAGDLLWYPVEGDNKTRVAPDVMVAFGRPKGDSLRDSYASRGSYQQWREDNIPPQVVFEMLSPGNTIKEMFKKFRFYERYGVEEYYLYNPDRVDLAGWLRSGEQLEIIEEMAGWVSPRLGVRFELEEGELVIYRPDGQRFATYLELAQQREQAQQLAEQERLEKAQAQQLAVEQQQRAESAETLLEQERARSQALLARLQELGINLDLLEQ